MTATNPAPSIDQWAYTDQDEAELAFFLSFKEGLSLRAMDDFIDGRQGVQLSDHRREELLEIRAGILAAWRSCKIELSIAHAWRLDAVCVAVGTAHRYHKGNVVKRQDKPGVDTQLDLDRNTRIRKFNARLVANGESDHIKQTAAEFGLSTKQISRIVNPKPMPK